MTLPTYGLFFLVGHFFGVAIAAIYTRMYDRSWASGLIIVALSFPVTIVYFFLLWGLARWRPFFSSFAGMAVAGVLSAIFPLVCGPFPVYAVRLGLAVPVLAAQLLVLIVAAAIFAQLPQSATGRGGGG